MEFIAVSAIMAGYVTLWLLCVLGAGSYINWLFDSGKYNRKWAVPVLILWIFSFVMLSTTLLLWWIYDGL